MVKTDDAHGFEDSLIEQSQEGNEPDETGIRSPPIFTGTADQRKKQVPKYLDKSLFIPSQFEVSYNDEEARANQK